MRVDIPSIKVSYTKNNLEFVKEVIYGIEEEGIPYEITEEEFSDVIKKAYEESFNSRLSFGIALNDEKAAFHFSKFTLISRVLFSFSSDMPEILYSSFLFETLSS